MTRPRRSNARRPAAHCAQFKQRAARIAEPPTRFDEAGADIARALEVSLAAMLGEAKLRVTCSAEENSTPDELREDVGPIAANALITILGAKTQLVLGDGRFLAANLLPKAKRLDPIAGFGRMLGMQGLIELGKSLLKVVLLAAIAWFWASAHISDVLGLGRGALASQLASAWQGMIVLLLLLAAGLVGIALIDWPIQFLRRQGRLKMSAQEMRDEHKEAEGSPEKRAAIRQRQRTLARGGVAGAVAKAQFVLTNPSHFSVALAYDPALADAPIVLAKGRGDKALAMRDLAAEHQVPVLEYPALARSVYFTTRENQVIRSELYVAVASLLAFVLSVKRGEQPHRPAVSVPVELRFDAQGRPQRA